MQRALREYESHSRTIDAEVRAERRRLVEQYGPLVKRVARRIARRLPSGSELEEGDLFSAGILGLFEAAARFDPEVGHPFETFAEFRIKGAMLDQLRRRDFLPRRLRSQANRYKRCQQTLERELGREPTDEEMAAAMEMTLDDLLRLRDDIAPYHYVSSDDPSVALPAAAPAPDALVSRREMAERLTFALQRLPEREALVLDLYFRQELTLREIGAMLDLTIGRISQIKTAAIGRLREIMLD